MVKLTNIHPIHCTPNSYLFYGILLFFFFSSELFFCSTTIFQNFGLFSSSNENEPRETRMKKKTSGFLPRTKCILPCMLCIKVIDALVVRIVKSHHSRPTTIVYYDGVCIRAYEC